jgi:TRAP-type transport system periplasmic protein
MRRRRFLAAMGPALASAAPGAGTAQAQTRWVMATPYAENFHTLNIRAFIQDVEQATGGRLSVQLHNNASLLPMAQIKRGVQTGQVQLG